MRRYWLMKSEPDVYSIDDLKSDKTTLWEGVRNYQARNFMVKDAKPGDEVLFYHSNAEPSGIAGTAKIVQTAVPDPSQFDKKSEYFDAKSKPENPTWFCVKVSYGKTFKNFLSLEDLKENPALSKMLLLKKGQRLSIQPVTEEEFKLITHLGNT